MIPATQTFFGRRHEAIGYGAPSVAESLRWPGESSDGAASIAPRAASHSPFAASLAAAAHRHRESNDDDSEFDRVTGGDGFIVPQPSKGWAVKLTNPTADEMRSEVRDQYRHFASARAPPVDPLPRGDDASASLAATAALAAAPRAKTPRPTHTGGVASVDCQTETPAVVNMRVAPRAAVRPPPPRARVSNPTKPPFAAYGRGNARPVSSADFLASYNLNPLLHPRKRESADAPTKAHKVYESAITRINFDASKFSARALAARGVSVGSTTALRSLRAPPAATPKGPTRGVQIDGSGTIRGDDTSPHVRVLPRTPSGEEFRVCSIVDNRRTVATQRTAFQLEDELVAAGSFSNAGGLDLAWLTVRAPQLVSIEAAQRGTRAREPRALDDLTSAPRWRDKQVVCAPRPFGPGKSSLVLNRDAFMDLEAGHALARAPPPPPPPPNAAARAAELAAIAMRPAPGTGRRAGGPSAPPPRTRTVRAPAQGILPPLPPPPPFSNRAPPSKNISTGVSGAMAEISALHSILSSAGEAVPPGGVLVQVGGRVREPAFELVPTAPDLTAFAPPPAPTGPAPVRHVLPRSQPIDEPAAQTTRVEPPPPPAAITFNTKTWGPIDIAGLSSDAFNAEREAREAIAGRLRTRTTERPPVLHARSGHGGDVSTNGSGGAAGASAISNAQ